MTNQNPTPETQGDEPAINQPITHESCLNWILAHSCARTSCKIDEIRVHEFILDLCCTEVVITASQDSPGKYIIHEMALLYEA